MATQSVQANSPKQATAEIRLPILLFTSVLMGVLLVLWITASFTSSAENNEAGNHSGRTENISAPQGIVDRQPTAALCGLQENDRGDC